MSKAQREAVHQAVRDYPLNFSGDLEVARKQFHELLTSRPLAEDVRISPTELGGVPAVAVTLDSIDSPNVVLHFHGGGFVSGSAPDAAALVSDLVRHARTRAVSVDYRLAPEHPYPAAVDDTLAAYRALLDSGVPATHIAFAGESAGGGLVLATLLAAKAAGVPQPSAAVLMSAWVDLTISGESVNAREAIDPSLTPADLAACADRYAGAADRTDPLISPLFGDLSGLAPLLIQVGGDEILLDDSTRLAARAAAANVPVLLDVTPEVPHVFQGMSAVLDEAGEALDRAATFLQSHWGTTAPRQPVAEHYQERAANDRQRSRRVAGLFGQRSWVCARLIRRRITVSAAAR
jgi:epsilon-lactone hydrolase